MTIKISKFMLLIAGFLEIVIGVVHFMMPYQIQEINTLSPYLKAFIIHGITAVGLCQLIFGLLTLYFSRIPAENNQIVQIFISSQVLLWIVRTAFEFIWPVKISLFSIPNPTVYVIILCIIMILLFLIPLVSIIKKKERP